MKEVVEIIDTGRLDELIEQVYDSCLICPAPYDYNSKDYKGLECPDVDCKVCWRRYLQIDKKNHDVILKLLEYGQEYEELLEDLV